MTAAGVVTTLATGFTSPDGIALDVAGGRLFVTNSSGGGIDQVTIPAGVVTRVATTTLNGGDNVTGCVYVDGIFIYRASSGRLEALSL